MIVPGPEYDFMHINIFTKSLKFINHFEFLSAREFKKFQKNKNGVFPRFIVEDGVP